MKIVPRRRRTHEPLPFLRNMEPKTWLALLEDLLRLNCVSQSKCTNVGRHLLCKFSPRLFYPSCTSSMISICNMIKKNFIAAACSQSTVNSEDGNEGNNSCLLHPNRCKQDTSVSKNRTEFSTTEVASQYKEW
ncbi:hypothetical protein T01_15450 [Trichinella spiralis]|uniref:Uncharacterized protein n=1 Tax=Trichinella spiralis TaxID=6334 RepID=A0A0V1B1K3_TRISP|nr:hypothetical protein T01_15450 [Trichinella spiralis]